MTKHRDSLLIRIVDKKFARHFLIKTEAEDLESILELVVQIVGTGAVGLAYGYLLSAHGHRVLHKSIGGRVLGPVRTGFQDSTTGTTTYSVYDPALASSEDDPTQADLLIFAIPHPVMQQQVHDGAIGSALPSPPRALFFTSVYQLSGNDGDGFWCIQ